VCREFVQFVQTGVTSLATSKVRLDGVLSNPSWLMSLLIGEGLD